MQVIVKLLFHGARYRYVNASYRLERNNESGEIDQAEDHIGDGQCNKSHIGRSLNVVHTTVQSLANRQEIGRSYGQH